MPRILSEGSESVDGASGCGLYAVGRCLSKSLAIPRVMLVAGIWAICCRMLSWEFSS